MKKFLLLCSVALLTFSSCSKEKDEPIVKSNESEQTSINLHIEGEREDISVADAEGRVLDLKAGVTGNKITSVSMTKTGDVKAILCFYTSTKGISREVTLPMENGKITWRGSVDVGNFTKEELRDAKLSIFIGGDYTYPGDDKPIVYNPTLRKAIRTTNGMDLSQFKPVFASEGISLTDGGSGSDVDFDSKGHRFRLMGQFVSISFRNPIAGRALRFNGLIVSGFATEGMTLYVTPSAGRTKPTFNYNGASRGFFYPFSDGSTIDLPGPATQGGAAVAPAGDPSYTIYVYSQAQALGGVRFGKDAASGVSPFSTPGFGMFHNVTTLDNIMDQNTPAKQGKFYNVVMSLRTR